MMKERVDDMNLFLLGMDRLVISYGLCFIGRIIDETDVERFDVRMQSATPSTIRLVIPRLSV